MSEEEIADPGTISYERLSLMGHQQQAKIAELNTAGTIGTKEGAIELLEAFGCGDIVNQQGDERDEHG